MIDRRAFLVGLGAVCVLGATAPRVVGAQARPDPLLPLWEAWKRIHVSSAGRIIDRLQDNVSHSEGQGYALLIAEALGDREGFETILDWTMQNLAVRDDALLAWRWHPAEGGRVTDRNNASDGDLFAAWALLRAAERFETPRYREMAAAIAADLVRLCVRPWPGRTEALVLLPGAEGFETEQGYLINPAYYMLRAMRELGAATEAAELVALAADGNATVSLLSRDALPPDWAETTPEGFRPATGKSTNFGYEAMRVPLYLVWSGLPGHPAVIRARDAYAADLEGGGDDTPVVIDPATGAVRERSADPGYRALAALGVCAGGGGTADVMPAFSAGQPYYPGVLHLLTLIALRETTLGCTLR
jgi:endoglucanase